MRNTSVGRIMRVLAKLTKSDVREMVSDGFLRTVDTTPIYSLRAKYVVRITGRKWLAPLYRPMLSTVTIKPGTFVALRRNKSSCDIEFVDEHGESVVYTVRTQDWNEKEPYFLIIPPERFRGRLGAAVKHILQLRRNSHGRE